MKTPSLPKFTAEASLFTTVSHSSPVASEAANVSALSPQQFLLPPWSHCEVLFYRCTKGDRTACRQWRLRCVPE